MSFRRSSSSASRRPIRRPSAKRQAYRPARLDYASGYFERTPSNKNEALTIPIWLPKVVAFWLIIAFIIWFFTASSFFKVKDIRVEGPATPEVSQAIEALRGRNILWLSVTHPDRMIRQKQPSLKQIQILRGIPDTLRVKLIEREPALIWQTGDSWYTLDATGFVFAKSPLNKKEDGSFDLPATNLPILVDKTNLPVKMASYIIRPTFIVFVNDLRRRLPEEFNLQLARLEISETTYSLTAVTDAGWSILFHTGRQLDPQLRTLAKVLESKRSEIKEYIDVRVGGWVYYK